MTELHMFLSGSYVISIHRGPCAELEELRGILERDPDRGEQFVLHKIFDALTDSFFPILSSSRSASAGCSCRRRCSSDGSGVPAASSRAP